VNAAGLVPVSQPSSGLAPGSIASLFGQNLAATMSSAAGFPLPIILAGTSVTVNGATVPLFYVSPNQINFQVPSDAPWSSTAYGQISIVVTTATGSSDPIVADGVEMSGMIFTQDGGGCGHPGTILNVAADGRRSLNTPTNSVSPGEFVEIYGTGIGPVYNSPPDGSPASSNPLSRAIQGSAGASFDFQSFNATVTGAFTGRAPGLVGVDQVNSLVPLGVREGCDVPVLIGPTPATVSIHAGGGQCVDPAIQSTGSLLLKKSVVLNDGTVPETDSFSGTFSASPGKQPPPPPPPLPYGIANSGGIPSPFCAIPGYSTPDAGVITLSGPGLPSTQAAPATSNGVTSYDTKLPAGSVSSGTYQIAAVGGDGIGKFQVPVTVGSGVQVTSQFPQGQVTGETLVVNWTGGAAGEAVTVTVVQHELGFDHLNYQVVPATTGTVSFGIEYNILNVLSSEIDVQVGPDPSQPKTFAAAGLTLGGQVSWMIEYRFIGLTF
jgi:uncharacterized protein (TIGR03437 family)